MQKSDFYAKIGEYYQQAKRGQKSLFYNNNAENKEQGFLPCSLHIMDRFRAFPKSIIPD
jgi:hypothetical protein